MAVILNEAAITALLTSPDGPVGRDLLRRTSRVEERARANASGPVIGELSGDLLSALHSEIRVDERGLVAAVLSDPPAHRGWQYPRIVARAGGVPGDWLRSALEAHDG